MRDRRRVTVGEATFAPERGDPRRLDVSVTPLLSDENVALGASIAFEDVTRYAALQTKLDGNRRDIELAYEELQSTIDELETTNEELQSANEELQTTNEELQSTNEELETMNEELQSTNEELETINDELRERTGELNQVNDFLETILTSLGFGVAVLDAHQRVQVWNRRAEDLWVPRAYEAVDNHFLSLDIGLPSEQSAPALRAVLGGTSEREKPGSGGRQPARPDDHLRRHGAPARRRRAGRRHARAGRDRADGEPDPGDGDPSHGPRSRGGGAPRARTGHGRAPPRSRRRRARRTRGRRGRRGAGGQRAPAARARGARARDRRGAPRRGGRPAGPARPARARSGRARSRARHRRTRRLDVAASLGRGAQLGDMAADGAPRSSTVRSRSAAVSPCSTSRFSRCRCAASRAASSEVCSATIPIRRRRPSKSSLDGRRHQAAALTYDLRPAHRHVHGFTGQQPGAVLAAHELPVTGQLGQGRRDRRPARTDQLADQPVRQTPGTAIPSRATRPQRSARCQKSASRRRSTRLSCEIACVTASRCARSERRSTITAPISGKRPERDGGPPVDQAEPYGREGVPADRHRQQLGRTARYATGGGCRPGRAAPCSRCPRARSRARARLRRSAGRGASIGLGEPAAVPLADRERRDADTQLVGRRLAAFGREQLTELRIELEQRPSATRSRAQGWRSATTRRRHLMPAAVGAMTQGAWIARNRP